MRPTEAESLQALNDGALLLAALVRDHQIAVATAYPETVKQSGFLGADPTQHAAGKAAGFVIEQLEAQNILLNQTKLDQFRARFLDRYAALGDPPAPGNHNGWINDADNEPLVVTLDDDGKPVVRGRAAAPKGIEGMGSHTTAWVSEVQEVERMMPTGDNVDKRRPYLDKGQAALVGPLMTVLGPQLPIDQLDGEQLQAVFHQAAALKQVVRPEDAVREYLKLRNLLPYATVDAGDRGGKRERRGKKKENWDGKAMEEALSLKFDEISEPMGEKSRPATIAALRKAAYKLEWILDPAKAAKDKLIQQAKIARESSMSDDDSDRRVIKSDIPTDVDIDAVIDIGTRPAWGTVPGIGPAVRATIVALRAEADRLETTDIDEEDASPDAVRLTTIRKTEAEPPSKDKRDSKTKSGFKSPPRPPRKKRQTRNRK
jgi:hypothetical protein